MNVRLLFLKIQDISEQVVLIVGRLMKNTFAFLRSILNAASRESQR